MHSNVIIKQKVNAPIDKVWNAITDKEQLKEWYHPIPDFSTKIHSEFSFYSNTGTEENHHHHCEVLEVIPNEKLKFSLAYPEITKEKTLLKWELLKDGNDTWVTLTHKGLENLEHLGNEFSHEKFEKRWDKIVNEQLKNYVEN